MQVFPLHLEEKDSTALMERFGVSVRGRAIMRDRFSHHTFVVKGISCAGANALKQHLLSLGGEAAVPAHAITGQGEPCNLLLTIRKDHLPALIARLREQWFHLPELADTLEQFMTSHGPWYDFSFDRIPHDRPAIMGIVNVTPDSFSDGGKYCSIDTAVRHAEELLTNGADIVDIGGESSRPGAEPVSADEEMRRILPVITILRNNNPTAVISVDTAKPEVARAALDAGADIVNDITALCAPKMREVAAAFKAPVVLMHMQGSPRTMQENPRYEDVLAEINLFLGAAAERAMADGVPRERIIIDPGFGFGKTFMHNLTILRHLEALSIHRFPILVGLSRKSFVGTATERKVPEERAVGTIAAHTIALTKGAAILRVHDVAAARETIALCRAVREAPCS